MLDHLQGKSNVYKAKKGAAAPPAPRADGAMPTAPMAPPRRCQTPAQKRHRRRCLAAAGGRRADRGYGCGDGRVEAGAGTWLEMLCAVAEQLPHAVA